MKEPMKKLTLILTLLLLPAGALAYSTYTGGWQELSYRSLDNYNGLKCLATNAGSVPATCGGQYTANPWCQTTYWPGLRYTLYGSGIWVGNKQLTTMTIQGVRYDNVVQRFGYSGQRLGENYATCTVARNSPTFFFATLETQ